MFEVYVVEPCSVCYIWYCVSLCEDSGKDYYTLAIQSLDIYELSKGCDRMLLRENFSNPMMSVGLPKSF